MRQNLRGLKSGSLRDEGGVGPASFRDVLAAAAAIKLLTLGPVLLLPLSSLLMTPTE